MNVLYFVRFAIILAATDLIRLFWGDRLYFQS